MSQPRFRVNTPSVIFERFDEEVVAINMDKGTYHSMAGPAADAFVLLSEEATPEELAEALSNRYAATPEQIGTALSPFLEQLENEQLIVPAATSSRGGLCNWKEIRPVSRSPLRPYRRFGIWKGFCCWTRFTR
jgi:hypothetical protein